MQQELFHDDIDKDKLSDDDLMIIQKSLNQELIIYLRKEVKEGRALFIPGNTPSLKNNYEVIQIPTKNAICHNKAPLIKIQTNVWKCSSCGRQGSYSDMKHTISSIKKKQKILDFQEEKKGYFLQNKIIWKNILKHKKKPYNIAFYFIRNSLHKFDYINAAHIIADMFTDFGYYEDDNTLYFMPEFLGFHYDKLNPGVVIILMTDELYDLKKKIYA